jgi:hypothetical protein
MMETVETIETINAFIWFIIPFIVAALVASIITGGFGEKIVGKKIGILGLPQSGKTRLGTFLAEKEFPREAIQTMANEPLPVGKKISMRMKDLKIDVIWDSRSHKAEGDYDKESEIIKKCEIILYLFKASEIFNDTESINSKRYFKMMKKEINIYSKMFERIKESKDVEKSKIFILIGTHSDMLKDTANSNLESEIACLIDSFSGNDFCKAEYLGLHSLLNDENAERLEIDIFNALKRIIEGAQASQVKK